MNYLQRREGLERLKTLVPNHHKRHLKRFFKNCFDTYRYRRLIRENDSLLAPVRRLIFVCKGNICRSAFAEHYLKNQIQAGEYVIESCGLDCDQGTVSPQEAIRAAGEFGVNLSNHRAKGLASCSFEDADLILPMEFNHYHRLQKLFPAQCSKIRLLREFAPKPEGFLCNIHDPYGLEEREYRRCFRMLQKAVGGLKALSVVDQN
jgi:protein-tyrosine phosphatase